MPNHGITLVALVITIIVLVILVGVTINAIIQQGLISNAERAVGAYDTAQKEEEQWLAEVEGIQEANENKWTGEIAANYAEGEGTQQNPYLIETPEQLAYLAQQVNGGETYEGTYFEITKSMSLENNKWTPIGLGPNTEAALVNWTMNIKFKGNIDGKNHVITNLKIEELDTWGVGLFGILDEGGSIKNIQVISGEVNGQTFVGGIVGASKGTIEGCINKATITAIDKTNVGNTGEEAGGITGCTFGNMKDCKNYGKVTTRNTYGKTRRGKYAGGITGTTGTDLVIENCENYGEVTAEYQQAGGITGRSK